MAGRFRPRAVTAFVLLLIPVTLVSGAPPAAAAYGCPEAPYGVNRFAPGSGRTAALTFDDGPGRDTGRILSVLAAKHVIATFFNLGSLEYANPAMVRAERAAGHALAGHTWDHAWLSGMSASAQLSTINGQRLYEASITGAYPCFFRPPYGGYDSTSLAVAQQLHMRFFTWSVDPQDWRAAGSGSSYWVQHIVSVVEAGTMLQHPVILLHNSPGGSAATVAALPTIIDYYRARGYTFVDLFGNSGPPRVRSVSPSSGSTSGGTRVAVYGSDLRGVQAVLFGRVPGTNVQVLSDRVLVTTPRYSAARVDITLLSSHGTSRIVPADRFTFVAPPSVTGISPRDGPNDGGTVVTVTGTDFRNVMAVSFGSRLGTHLRVLTPNQLMVTAPPGTEGVAPIRVRTAYGVSAERSVDRFTYLPPEPPLNSAPPRPVPTPSMYTGPPQ